MISAQEPVTDAYLALNIDELLSARMVYREQNSRMLGFAADLGPSRSRVRGQGSEFDTVGPFLDGDDPRFIDWNATARTGRPQVRRFFVQAQQPVVLVVDLRSHMFFGTQAQVLAKTACLLAAALSREYVRTRRPLSLMIIDDEQVQSQSVVSSTKARYRILSTLLERYEQASLKSSSHDSLTDAIRHIGPSLNPRSELVLISDFSQLGEGLDNAVSELRKISVTAVIVEDAMAQAVFTGWFPYRTDLKGSFNARSVARLTPARFKERVLGWHQELEAQLTRAGFGQIHRCSVSDLIQARMR